MSFSNVARSASKHASASLNDDDELLLALAVAVGLEVVLLLLRLPPPPAPPLFECRGACPVLAVGEAGCEADSMAPLLLLLLPVM